MNVYLITSRSVEIDKTGIKSIDFYNRSIREFYEFTVQSHTSFQDYFAALHSLHCWEYVQNY